jgi:MerR family transcriptional regulator, heat shock protein HspR
MDAMPVKPAAGAEAASPTRRVEDADYPAYSMGAAAAILDVTPEFLRGLGEVGLLVPQRSAGRHRRYSRHQLDQAGRARILVDSGLPLAAAARIIELEDRLAAAEHLIEELRWQLDTTGGPPSRRGPRNVR